MLKPCVIHVRVTHEEFAALARDARQRGIAVSRLVRERTFGPGGEEPVKRDRRFKLPAARGMVEVHMAPPAEGLCPHHHAAGELCYKRDGKLGWPAIG
jgi:hypothetical protein